MLKKLLYGISLTKAFIAFIRLIRNPMALDRVFELAQEIARPEELERMGAYAAARSEAAARALETFPRLDIARLKAIRPELKDGSLGAAFFRFLEERKLDPASIPALPSRTRAEYVQAHLYETHDLWHVLTGFEVDVQSELGLQAFYLAQLPGPLASMLLAAGFINLTFYAMSDRVSRMEQITRGWSLGKRAKPLFGVDWNDYWRKPLTEVRGEFGLADSEVPPPFTERGWIASSIST